ncbi:MAG: hypothetical protein KBT29_06430 [Prevotellaceae bacterium]|nr:hypothetical protein [Candidatus Minthosoma caballi]
MTKVITHLDDISKIEQKNNGKLIHINGKATTEEILTDNAFDCKYNALCLMRNVYYYQWDEVQEEEKHIDKNGKEYKKTRTNHYKGWYTSPINSDNFIYKRYKNIAPIRMNNDTVFAENVQVGAFVLNDNQMTAITKMENADVELEQQFINDFRNSTTQLLGRDVNVEVGNGVVFIGAGSLDNPSIGDIKVRFTIAKPCDVTITGMQNGNKIESYILKDDSILDIRQGTLTVEEYLSDIEKTNSYGTWGGRISALIFIVWSFFYIFPVFKRK